MSQAPAEAPDLPVCSKQWLSTGAFLLPLGDPPSPIRREGWVFKQGVIENHVGLNYTDISVIVVLPVKICNLITFLKILHFSLTITCQHPWR